MVKHKVSYSVRGDRNVLILKERTFDTVEAACSHFRDVRGKSFTIPLMETVVEKDIHDRSATR
jgi:hypothetical protein